MPKPIEFYHNDQDYDFLSNVSPVGMKFQIDNVIYDFSTSENLYQGLKLYTADEKKVPHAKQDAIKDLFNGNPGAAAQEYMTKRKKDGNPDFNKKIQNSDLTVKEIIMRDIVVSKFTQNPILLAALLLTEDSDIIENSREDRFWGNGKDKTGRNALGKIHMLNRKTFREELQTDGNIRVSNYLGRQASNLLEREFEDDKNPTYLSKEEVQHYQNIIKDAQAKNPNFKMTADHLSKLAKQHPYKKPSVPSKDPQLKEPLIQSKVSDELIQKRYREEYHFRLWAALKKTEGEEQTKAFMALQTWLATLPEPVQIYLETLPIVKEVNERTNPKSEKGEKLELKEAEKNKLEKTAARYELRQDFYEGIHADGFTNRVLIQKTSTEIKDNTSTNLYRVLGDKTIILKALEAAESEHGIKLEIGAPDKNGRRLYTTPKMEPEKLDAFMKTFQKNLENSHLKVDNIEKPVSPKPK